MVDRDDHHHNSLIDVFEGDPGAWIFPWAILPEVDYLLGKLLGEKVRKVFFEDLSEGAFPVEWGNDDDVKRAHDIDNTYSSLGLGLVDSTVISIAERFQADAIATLDLRHFGAIRINGNPRLLPRDI